MNRSRRLGMLAAILVASTVTAAAQIGGKLVVGGNPTPGTEQPEPPSLADRITVSGCLQVAAVRGGGSSTSATATVDKSDPPRATVDANTLSDSRFVLVDAERIDRVPAGTGGSPATAGVASRSYRLTGIESQFSPFVNTKVEISGEIKPAVASDATSMPTLIVEFIQKLASICK
jgi:hypothetical protein